VLNKKLLKSKTYRIIYRKIKQIGACNVNDVHKRTLHTVGLHMENVHFFTIVMTCINEPCILSAYTWRMYISLLSTMWLFFAVCTDVCSLCHKRTCPNLLSGF